MSKKTIKNQKKEEKKETTRKALEEPGKKSIIEIKGEEEPIIKLAKDTIKKNRQAIIFVNTKRSAESQAEKIMKKLKKEEKTEKQEEKSHEEENEELNRIKEEILKAMEQPTKQCEKLAKCVEKGIAFHHSGLHSKQKEIIEEEFKKKNIKIIVATPTLAAGVDLPAYRVIIRDLKRYSGWGMNHIPVLEYEQMAGRAGRPGKDPWGEAIIIAKNNKEKEELKEKYLKGEPEEIYSKLAVETALRTHTLSLIASSIIRTRKELEEFFEETFYAKQYNDTEKLRRIIKKIITQLEEWEFIETREEAQKKKEKKEKTRKEKEKKESMFRTASELIKEEKEDKKAKNENKEEKIIPTRTGKRIAELYLDPLSAKRILEGIKKSKEKTTNEFSWLQLISTSLEIKPRIRVKEKEINEIERKIEERKNNIIIEEDEEYYYEEILEATKTALILEEWANEKGEEEIMEKYDVRPGELHAKIETTEWLLRATQELAKINNEKKAAEEIRKLRTRIKYGAKEELIPLLKLEGIGKARARKLYNNKIRNIADIKRTEATTLAQLIGKKTMIKIKEQAGEKISPEKIIISEKKRKGQTALTKWAKK